MDGSDDQNGTPRRRVGRRTWLIRGAAGAVAVGVVVGVLVVGGEPAGVAAPYACRVSGEGAASATATASGRPASDGTAPGTERPARKGTVPPADFDGDGNPDLALGSGGSVEGGSGGGSIEVAYGTGTGRGSGAASTSRRTTPGYPATTATRRSSGRTWWRGTSTGTGTPTSRPPSSTGSRA
ncbi:hypothetical protein ACQPXT_18390 [Streptomyces sp. CA-100214]